MHGGGGEQVTQASNFCWEVTQAQIKRLGLPLRMYRVPLCDIFFLSLWYNPQPPNQTAAVTAGCVTVYTKLSIVNTHDSHEKMNASIYIYIYIIYICINRVYAFSSRYLVLKN